MNEEINSLELRFLDGKGIEIGKRVTVETASFTKKFCHQTNGDLWFSKDVIQVTIIGTGVLAGAVIASENGHCEPLGIRNINPLHVEPGTLLYIRAEFLTIADDVWKRLTTWPEQKAEEVKTEATGTRGSSRFEWL